MEKSIMVDFRDYIRESLRLPEVDVKTYSPLVLAYIGDCVFDLVIKSMVISGGNKQVQQACMKKQVNMCRHRHSQK